MSLENIKKDLMDLEAAADNFVDKAKAKVMRNPWPFIGGFAVLALVGWAV